MRDDDKSSNGTLVDPSHDRLPHVKVDAGLRGFNHCTEVFSFRQSQGLFQGRQAEASVMAIYSPSDFASRCAMGDTISICPSGEGTLYGS